MVKSEDLGKIRHSLAHLLAAAVTELYPKALPTLGPAIDNGFYYDFDELKISEEDLPKIEQKMRELAKNWTGFVEEKITKEKAEELYRNNPYKLELITEIIEKGEAVTFYKSGPPAGGFTDLCRGGHVDDFSKVDLAGFKLDRVAGAYWRGDEKNKMLTRIYGLAFGSADELNKYSAMRLEAEKRDHRKLGKELDIFIFDDDTGPGLPLWLPNGTIIIEELETLAKETETKAGYDRVKTPHLAKESMYQTSGHLPYYEDSMFPPMEYEGGKYYLKAMNCPHHHKIFAARPRSYKDLPIRLAEYGTVYRHEKSGELFGLMRVRMLSMNDAHIYCTEEQFANEFKAVNEMYLRYFKIFGIDKYVMRFSTHDPKKMGKKYVAEPELWQKTEKMVRQVLIDAKIPFVEIADEAAFYGPKIDVQVWSAIGREFTLATNQVDFAVPARFGLTYVDKNGQDKTPLCIHRAPLGTHERFIGFLIEHYGGAFPLWLSPVQVAVLPVAESHAKYAEEIAKKLKLENIRAISLPETETLGRRIREVKMKKIPYFIVIGDTEKKAKKLTIEDRGGKKQKLTLPSVIKKLQTEIKTKK